ncbi:hypothetical protein NG895_18985 [Aeoliella sp. ICT_H6.2]|uniref:Uncharacterized protein n=1 Tax=Aeoliella straminimaris TaxID=2954799 RepID=A0A9X2JK71_9BACT|nr:hypothetical protein [Aeoliella straminimaris]MCO6045989.1 hypothetical protein [Aeoliella straminimaris]
MNAHDLTFGIEFETTLPSAQADALCPSCGRPPQVTWLPEGWKAMTDCSIQASSGRRGIEFVSPVLQGAADCSMEMAKCSATSQTGLRSDSNI